MSNEEPQDDNREQEREPQLVPQESDWFLQLLVNMVNDGLELGLTLQVGGFLVSGIAVSAKKYFDATGEQFSSTMSDSESIKQLFATLGEQEPLPEGQLLPPPNYIHLKDARYFHNSGHPMPMNQPIWWRGRICQVGGFSIGVMSAST